jgi:hypothetical protein
MQALAKSLDLPETSVLAFSATEKWGVEEVWSSLLETC